ncbi:MAG: RlmF-related methyltransferase [Candidatus Heimdallarchaeota archaeon]|nr:RlmF-related methyltransferase [Candidatus Heimdallarchaeota archaeon]
MVQDIEEELEAKYFTIPFEELVEKNPELAIYAISINPVKFDLGNPEVLSSVNQCLFKTVLDIDISVPEGHLIPTLGIRYAYCQAVTSRIKSSFPCVEIGTGASAAITLILAKEYQREVISTELSQVSSSSAELNIINNQLDSTVTLLKSEGEIMRDLIPKGRYSALLCYPPLYEQDLTRLEKKRGWKGTYEELIGGGKDGLNFTRNLVNEVLSTPEIEFEFVSLLLSSEELVDKIIAILPEDIEIKIVQINAGTRKRFILLFYPKK